MHNLESLLLEISKQYFINFCFMKLKSQLFNDPSCNIFQNYSSKNPPIQFFLMKKLIRQIKKQTDLNDKVNIALRIRCMIIIPYLSFLSPALPASLLLESFWFSSPRVFIISKIDLYLHSFKNNIQKIIDNNLLCQLLLY